jgi:hypothetical protein
MSKPADKVNEARAVGYALVIVTVVLALLGAAIDIAKGQSWIN